MIGDSETVSKDKFLKSLMDYMNKEGEVRSAQELINGRFGFVNIIVLCLSFEQFSLSKLCRLVEEQSDQGLHCLLLCLILLEAFLYSNISWFPVLQAKLQQYFILPKLKDFHHMSSVMRKPAFSTCENKVQDQLLGN